MSSPNSANQLATSTPRGPVAIGCVEPTLSAFLHDMLKDAGLPTWVVSSRQLRGGRNNTTILLTLGLNLRKIVLRVRKLSDVKYANGFAAERFVYPLIDGTSIRVPSLIHYCPPGSAAPFEFAFFEYIDGVDLVECGQRPDLYRVVGNMVGRMHRIRGDGFGDHSRIILPPEAGGDFLRTLFASEVPRFEACWPAPGELVRQFIRRHIPHSFDCGYPCLLHGDLTGLNLRVHRDRVYMIDFENSRFRQPGFDAPKMRLFCSRIGPRCWPAFVEGYREQCTVPMSDEAFLLPYMLYFHIRQANFEHEHPTTDHRFWPKIDYHIRAISDLIRNYNH